MTSTPEKVKSNHRWAILIGVGIALFPVHNQWLTNATAIDGMATLFLPAFGTLLMVMGTLLFLLNNYQNMDWGDRRVYVPLLVIVGAIGLSGITADSLVDKLSPLLMGLSLFALYLVARVLGRDMFLPLVIGAVIGAVGVLVHAVVFPGQLTGGFVFERNYDIVVGYVLLGAFLHTGRWRLPIIALAVIAILLTGSPEGIFALSGLAVVVVVRKDWGKGLFWIVVPLVMVSVIWFGSGTGQELYSYVLNLVQGERTVAYELDPETGEYIRRDSGDPPIVGEERSHPIQDRWNVIRDEMSALKPLGTGYSVTEFRTNTVHNVPLIIVQQLGWPGIAAALAWLWISFWGLFRTKWKYAWALLLLLSVMDHFVWTQLGPWLWALVGVSTAKNNIKTDLLFKGG